MQKIECGFSLTAILDGTTLNGFLRGEGLPLVQRYDKDTNKAPTPNFEDPALSEAEKPTLVLIITDVSDGHLMKPNVVKWKYNGQEITFGPDNLSTNEGFAGYFERIPEHTTSVSGKTVKAPALRIKKNLVVVGGYDNDRISVSGSVEVNGQSIAFNEIFKDVVIQQTSGSDYDVIISDNKNGFFILSKDERLEMTADLYKDGAKVQSMEGVTFEWFKIEGTGVSPFGTGQKKIITADDVNNILKIRCDVKINNSLQASGFTEITDFSDPIYGIIKITGIKGTVMRTGETAVLTPIARKRDGGEEVKVDKPWNFNLTDNEGKPFVLTGKSSATFAANEISVTYEDMKKAKMGLHGAVGINY